MGIAHAITGTHLPCGGDYQPTGAKSALKTAGFAGLIGWLHPQCLVEELNTEQWENARSIDMPSCPGKLKRNHGAIGRLGEAVGMETELVGPEQRQFLVGRVD